jgi:CDP-6-deoxy-D-xylo-4-hexulose-3-dehydrase
MKNNNKFLLKIINKYSPKNFDNKKYPLLENAFSNFDILKGVNVLLSRRITMSKITKKFEMQFGKFIGSKYCLMVNSGSSANLLAFFALINPKKKKKLEQGDECLVPAVCWSTSLWPIIQSGLKPRFIDVELNTFSPSLEIIKKNINKKTKAVILINILGNCSEMDSIRDFLNKKKIYLIEDTCEALGSKYKNKYLGTFGDFGTFSFYYSHQITSGEGGMIVCKNQNDYKILHSLRAHGWDRGLNNSKNNTFNFINSGFNLRPLDLNAAIASNQLKRLNQFKKIRSDNRNKIIKNLQNSNKWNNQFTFFEPTKNLDASWFGLPLLINKKYIFKKNIFLNYLNKNGIETRPILSGNFANQSSIKLYKINYNLKNLKNSQEIEERGFFIGLPTESISLKKLKNLTTSLLNIDKI